MTASTSSTKSALFEHDEPALAPRVRNLKPSSTVQFSETVRRFKREGRPVIGLSSGDPNIPTHPIVIEAAVKAMRDGKTLYSASSGRPELRELIAERARARSGVDYGPDDVLVTPGGKYALFVALQAVVGDGDEVITLDPSWVSYGPCSELAGAKPVVVDALDGLDREKFDSALNERTRAVIVNSPVNPTGRIVPREELLTILEIAEARNLWILFDEVYADIVFGPGKYTPLHALEGARARTLVIDSLSKTYGMTGWRLGYLLGPPKLIASARKILQHSIYCVPEFVQIAGEAALQLPASVVSENLSVFYRRLIAAAERLNRLPGVQCPIPEATFYLFPKIGRDDRALAERWLSEADVAVLPGSSFGAAGIGHVRIALTCSDDDLEEALQRIERLEGITS